MINIKKYACHITIKDIIQQRNIIGNQQIFIKKYRCIVDMITVGENNLMKTIKTFYENGNIQSIRYFDNDGIQRDIKIYSHKYPGVEIRFDGKRDKNRAWYKRIGNWKVLFEARKWLKKKEYLLIPAEERMKKTWSRLVSNTVFYPLGYKKKEPTLARNAFGVEFTTERGKTFTWTMKPLSNSTDPPPMNR